MERSETALTDAEHNLRHLADEMGTCPDLWTDFGCRPARWRTDDGGGEVMTATAPSSEYTGLLMIGDPHVEGRVPVSGRTTTQAWSSTS